MWHCCATTNFVDEISSWSTDLNRTLKNDVIYKLLLSFHCKTLDFINRDVLPILDWINRFIMISFIILIGMDDGLVAVVPEQVTGVHDGDEGIADVLTEQHDKVPGLGDQLVQHGPCQLLNGVLF